MKFKCVKHKKPLLPDSEPDSESKVRHIYYDLEVRESQFKFKLRYPTRSLHTIFECSKLRKLELTVFVPGPP